MSYVLRNVKHELYAQAIATGMTRQEAYYRAGYKGKNNQLERKYPFIQQRIDELLKASASRSQLTRRNILDRIFQDWELARKLGQVASALKAGELMGREMHKMFTERKEVGGPGDFDGKSEEELRDIIKKELGDLGWEGDTIPPDPSTLN